MNFPPIKIAPGSSLITTTMTTCDWTFNTLMSVSWFISSILYGKKKKNISFEEELETLHKGITKLHNILQGSEPNFTPEEHTTSC